MNTHTLCPVIVAISDGYTNTTSIDYPFNKPGEFPIETGEDGMGVVELLPRIGKAYIKQYKAAEKDDENGYWHGSEDLVIVGIIVNHDKKRITLSVDS